MTIPTVFIHDNPVFSYNSLYPVITYGNLFKTYNMSQPSISFFVAGLTCRDLFTFNFFLYIFSFCIFFLPLSMTMYRPGTHIEPHLLTETSFFLIAFDYTFRRTTPTVGYMFKNYPILTHNYVFMTSTHPTRIAASSLDKR